MKKSIMVVMLVVLLFVSSVCVFSYAMNGMEEIEGRKQRILGEWTGAPYSLRVTERGMTLMYWGNVILETTYRIQLTDEGTMIYPDKDWIITDGMSDISLMAVNEHIIVLKTEGDYGTRLYPLKTKGEM